VTARSSSGSFHRNGRSYVTGCCLETLLLQRSPTLSAWDVVDTKCPQRPISHTAEGWGTHSFSVARRRKLGRRDGRSAAVRDDDDGGGSAQRDTTRTATRVGRRTQPRASGVDVVASIVL